MITQSTDPDTLVAGTSVACHHAGGVTTENAWLRRFDLDGDHGLPGRFHVETVDWGTELVLGALDLTVNVYCVNETLPFLYQFMTLMDSVVVPLSDEELTFHTTWIGGSCHTATEDMGIELRAEDCNIAGCIRFYVGMNDLGQTAPTYIAAPDCGAIDPVDLVLFDFPDAHMVLVVGGYLTWGDGGFPDDGGCDDGGCDDGGICDDDGGGGNVPATTSVGAVLLLLILLGTAGYFLRRRASL
jgi:hypothetical protein